MKNERPKVLRPLRKLFRRKRDLIPSIVEEGKTAAKDGEIDNPYPKGTLEHDSWKYGYEQADDWDYVW